MTTAHDLLQQGIEALKAGRKAEARGLLKQVVQQDQHNETAWLWLSGAVDTDEQRRYCLEKVLEINPGNGMAQRGLERLEAPSRPPFEEEREPVEDRTRAREEEAPSPGRRPTGKREPKPTRKRLMVAVLAVLAVGAVITILAVGWAITRWPQIEEIAGKWIGVGPTPTATPVPTGKTGKWQLEQGTTDPFTDVQAFQLILESEEEIEGPLGIYTPTLTVMCQSPAPEWGKIGAYVIVGQGVEVEWEASIGEVAHAQIRFDGEPGERIVIPLTDVPGVGDMLIFMDKQGDEWDLESGGIPWVKRMLEHDRLLFGYWTYSSGREEVTFDLRGLREALLLMPEECRW
jgi:hypothetical protein